jgi:alpha-mannosidase
MPKSTNKYSSKLSEESLRKKNEYDRQFYKDNKDVIKLSIKIKKLRDEFGDVIVDEYINQYGKGEAVIELRKNITKTVRIIKRTVELPLKEIIDNLKEERPFYN